MASLSDRLDQDVEGWRPEAGDKVLGTVVSVASRASDYGDDYPYVEIEQEDGSIVGVHGFHTVLKNELARVKPAPGDTLGIKYKGKLVGKRTDAKGRPVEFEGYSVVHESKSASYQEPEWGSFSKSAAEEAAAGGIEEAFPGAKNDDDF